MVPTTAMDANTFLDVFIIFTKKKVELEVWLFF